MKYINDSWVCETCGDIFGLPVWECPYCRHHLGYEFHEVGDCKYCYRQTTDSRGRALPTLYRPPLEGETLRWSSDNTPIERNMQ